MAESHSPASGIRTITTGKVRILAINNPPVNALSAHVRAALWQAIEDADTDPDAASVIITGTNSFIAGADVREFGKPVAFPPIRDLLARIGNMTKPVIAAVDGVALGGGFELALACHYRIAAPGAVFGLPEVNLGLLPGAGGTQRLPRIVGAKQALDLILSARRLTAAEALDFGIIDGVAADPVKEAQVLASARRSTDEMPQSSSRRAGIDMGTPEFFAAKREDVARQYPGQIAPQAIVDCVEAAATLDFTAGIAFERDAFLACAASPQHKALTYLFKAESSFKKRSGTIDPQSVVRRLRSAIVSETARMVADGLIGQESDADVIIVREMGFPRDRGGPCFEAKN